MQSQNRIKNLFSSYHPLVNFLYFAVVITFSMVFMHPICLITSFIGAFAYSVKQKGRKAVRFSVVFMLPLLVAAALINPAFNHEGVTILTYLHDGNPLTLESILYGLAAALMIVSVICWFSCYNHVMTSDKFIYLFGRVIPSMSLILSMTLRFVPHFKAQIREIVYAQKCVGRDVSTGGMVTRIKNAINILSIMVTWALENAVETADSMKSRGYGLPGRTAFSIFKFDKRDAVIFGVILSLGLYVVLGGFMGGAYFRYFPSIKGTQMSLYAVSVFISHATLCLIPTFIER